MIDGAKVFYSQNKKDSAVTQFTMFIRLFFFFFFRLTTFILAYTKFKQEFLIRDLIKSTSYGVMYVLSNMKYVIEFHKDILYKITHNISAYGSQ